MKKPTKKTVTAAVDYLSMIQDLTLVLENGTTVVMSPRKELRMPDLQDKVAVWAASRLAPGQFAFWAYQSARALSAVRKAENSLEELEASTSLTYRKAVDTGMMEGGDVAWKSTDYGLIDSFVSNDRKIKESRRLLDTLRSQYDLIRSIRDAVEHRVYILRKAIGVESESLIPGR